MSLPALFLAFLSLSAGPAAVQEEAPQSLVSLAGDCAALVTWGEDRSADCQDGLLVRKYADGRIHFAVAVTPECCALTFEGSAALRTRDEDSVFQIIDRISLHRAGAPPFSNEGIGECRWPHLSEGAMTVTCEFVSSHDGKSTTLLFNTDGAEPNPHRF